MDSQQGDGCGLQPSLERRCLQEFPAPPSAGGSPSRKRKRPHPDEAPRVDAENLKHTYHNYAEANTSGSDAHPYGHAPTAPSAPTAPPPTMTVDEYLSMPAPLLPAPPAQAPGKRSRCSISLATKMDILRQVLGQGRKQAHVARELGLRQSTVRSIVVHADKIAASAASAMPLSAKRLTRKRKPLVEKTEELLREWLETQDWDGLKQEQVMGKARGIFNLLKAEQERQPGAPPCEEVFLASKGWYDRFRKRMSRRATAEANKGEGSRWSFLWEEDVDVEEEEADETYMGEQVKEEIRIKEEPLNDVGDVNGGGETRAGSDGSSASREVQDILGDSEEQGKLSTWKRKRGITSNSKKNKQRNDKSLLEAGGVGAEVVVTEEPFDDDYLDDVNEDDGERGEEERHLQRKFQQGIPAASGAGSLEHHIPSAGTDQILRKMGEMTQVIQSQQREIKGLREEVRALKKSSHESLDKLAKRCGAVDPRAFPEELTQSLAQSLAQSLRDSVGNMLVPAAVRTVQNMLQPLSKSPHDQLNKVQSGGIK